MNLSFNFFADFAIFTLAYFKLKICMSSSAFAATELGQKNPFKWFLFFLGKHNL